MPDIPAIAETVPGYDVSPWYGVLVPAGTPAAIVNKLHAEIAKAVVAPDIAQRLAGDGGTVVNHGPDEFAKIIVAERASGRAWCSPPASRRFDVRTGCFSCC